MSNDQNGLSWMNELMCGGEPSENSLLGRLVALGNRREDSDEDPEAQLEDLIDTRTCVALVIYLGMLIMAIIISCVLIVTQGVGVSKRERKREKKREHKQKNEQRQAKSAKNASKTMSLEQFWAGDVVLCCVIALYELSVLQLVVLAILRRRDIAGATARPADEAQNQSTASTAREIQLRTLG